MYVLPSFSYRHHPKINALLLLIEFAFCLDLFKQCLKDTDHVTVECNPNHFDTYGEKEFILCISFDVSVPNTCESCDNPVDS